MAQTTGIPVVGDVVAVIVWPFNFDHSLVALSKKGAEREKFSEPMKAKTASQVARFVSTFNGSSRVFPTSYHFS
jgi:hypothetical protein